MYYHGLITQPDCQGCPLNDGKSVMVYPDGKVPSRLILVGEGPGFEEEGNNPKRERKFFIGPTGRAQWYLTENGDPGFSRMDCWVTNTTLCRKRPIKPPGGGPTLSSDLVHKLAMDHCRKRLIGELLAVSEDHPDTVIVAVGKHSMKALTGIKGSIRDYRGSVNPIDLQELWKECHR
jgi:uracil-DNA glycosylase family 4